MFIIEKQRGNTVLPCKKLVIGNRRKISEKPVDIRTKPIYNRYIIKMSKDNTIPKNQRVFWFGNPNNCIKRWQKLHYFSAKSPENGFLIRFLTYQLYNPEFCRDSITRMSSMVPLTVLYNPEFCRVVSF